MHRRKFVLLSEPGAVVRVRVCSFAWWWWCVMVSSCPTTRLSGRGAQPRTDISRSDLYSLSYPAGSSTLRKHEKGRVLIAERCGKMRKDAVFVGS